MHCTLNIFQRCRFVVPVIPALSALLLIAATAVAEDAPLHQCDRLTASEFDPVRRAKPVSNTDLQPEQAMTACRQAMDAFPEEPRFQYQYARALYVANRLEEALAYCKQVSSTYPPAMTCVGTFFHGAGKLIGFPQDYGKAAEWFTKASKHGDLRAKMFLATQYREGQGVPKDTETAKQYYAESFPAFQYLAVNEGSVWAQGVLGWMYESGVGVERDLKAAYKWYEKAASQGSTYAESGLDRLASNAAPGGRAASSKTVVSESQSQVHFQVVSCDWGGYSIFFPEDEAERTINASPKSFVVAWIMTPTVLTERSKIDEMFSQAFRSAREKCENKNALAEVHFIYWREDYRKWSSQVFVRNVQDTHFAWGYATENGKVLYYNNPQAATAERRLSVMNFLKRAGVYSLSDMRELGANPFVYEDKVVLIEPTFDRMLSRSEGLFFYAWADGIFFIVSDVPTNLFTQQTKVLLAARVLGTKGMRAPSGGEALLPHLQYIDSFSDKYTQDDLKWAINQAKLQ